MAGTAATAIRSSRSSIVHGARYADYSHGVRLVSAVAYVDGRPRAIAEVLEDRQLAPVVSDEGPIPVSAVMLMEARSKVLAQAEQPNG